MLSRTQLIIVFCLIGACVVLLTSNRFWNWLEGVGMVPLTQNLQNQPDQPQPIFNARVKTRFPVGSPVADLLLELHKQGFTKNKSPSPDNEQSATRQDGANGICSFTATVFWTSDQNQRIKTLSGVYQSSCL